MSKRKSATNKTAKHSPVAHQRLVKTLSELLNEVQTHFAQTQKGPSYTYDYTLGKFPDGWCFNVVNSWHKWVAANRQHEFGRYQTPEEAVQAFLNYVRENRIMVHGLQES
jgi:hypothetical protein